MSEEIAAMKLRFDNCVQRSEILNFELKSRRFNSKLKFILNQYGNFHLNNCIWSKRYSASSVENCQCEFARHSPKQYLEKIIDTSSDVLVTDFHKLQSAEFCDEENEIEFYRRRILDKDNLFKWYDAYVKTVNALRFKIKVRELEVENEIDAILNLKSDEWHLTDCLRCINLNGGAHTCHCQKAMIDPWKYLEEKYNFLDIKSIEEKAKKKKKPENFISKKNIKASSLK